MLFQSDVKEELSYVYAHAIATKVGYSAERIVKDRDSVDLLLCAKGKLDPLSVFISPRLEVQLKATAQELSGDEFPFQLSIKNYNELSKYAMIPRILIVLSLSKIDEDWVSCTPEHLLLKGKAYWTCLTGSEEIHNRSSKTVYISKANVFNDEALKKIMIAASKGENLHHAIL